MIQFVDGHSGFDELARESTVNRRDAIQDQVGVGGWL